MTPQELYPVTPESTARALQARDAERAATGLEFDEDGRIQTRGVGVPVPVTLGSTASGVVPDAHN